MKATAKVTYSDGHSDEARITPRVLTSVEEHAQTSGWQPGEASEMRRSYYIAYLAQRFAGNTSLPYDRWMEDVDDIEVQTENPTR